MENNIQHRFTEKIKEAYRLDSDTALENAKRILDKLPVRLLPNIEEWCRGAPLSDIYIQNYSIPMILTLQKSNDFLLAVQIMTELEEDPDSAVRQIWNMRR